MDDFLRKLAADLAGAVLPGGCNRCDAEQVLTEELPGVFILTIRHDDDCPVLAAKRGTG